MGINFSQIRRTARILSPLLFLLVCLVIINLWPAGRTEVQETNSRTAVAPTISFTPPSSTAVPPTATTSPTATTTSTPIPTPTLPADATIRLLGPPAEALFRTTGTLVFYWQWPLPLSSTQQFQVVLLTPTGANIIGQISEPNLGEQYRLQIPASQAHVNGLSSAQWQVQLLTSSGEIVRSSPPRAIRFLEP